MKDEIHKMIACLLFQFQRLNLILNLMKISSEHINLCRYIVKNSGKWCKRFERTNIYNTNLIFASMTYEAEISRTNPSLVLFLIDQSRSMSHKLPGGERSKAQEASDAINRQIGDFVLRCTKSDGIRDYFHIGVIGYGFITGKADSILKGGGIHPISELATNPTRVEKRKMTVSDGAGGTTEVDYEFGVWFDPVANGDTPMCKALTLSRDIIKDWIAEHQASYQPIMINITDGQATDGDPEKIATEIMDFTTSDGAPLVWNCHLSSNPATPVAFPSDLATLPDDKYAKSLFSMSSNLPSQYVGYAREMQIELQDSAKAYVFNAQLEQLVEFIDIGTRGPQGQMQ